MTTRSTSLHSVCATLVAKPRSNHAPSPRDATCCPFPCREKESLPWGTIGVSGNSRSVITCSHSLLQNRLLHQKGNCVKLLALNRNPKEPTHAGHFY